MKEKTLFKIALICSIIGLGVLFFISGSIEIEEIDIAKITDADIGKEIKVIGRVERVSDTEKVMFLEVGQQKIEKISVVLFKEGDIKIKKGDFVEIVGELEEFGGEKSIIANAVKVR
ncbi:hypothetical protein GOV06_01600 [Candidatus Woesearchaeota archaeon]|nr:hypothetical protein [Candidatus Woesearchaeota archaeon]